MRVWIKVRLAEGDQDAARIVEDWRRERTKARNVARAIRVYAALLRGETSLLTEYFPWIALGISGRLPAQPQRPRIEREAPAVEYVQPSEADEAEDALDIGFGGLDI